MPFSALLPAQLRILLVEDNADDAFLTQEAFDTLEQPPVFTLCRDGLDALETLDLAVQGDGQIPHMILLDLNMPRLDGFGLLDELKRRAELRHIPVLVFSTSDSPDDVRRSYEKYASSYICKPRLFSEYAKVVEAVQSFWLHTAILPA